MVIDIEGAAAGNYFGHLHGHNEELEDRGVPEPLEDDEIEAAGELKRDRPVAEIVTYRGT